MAENAHCPMRTGCFPDFKEKKIMRIQYPGLVKNVNEALKTLGGLNEVELVSLLENIYLGYFIYKALCFLGCFGQTKVAVEFSTRR